MPDYSVIESLCAELDITIAELLDGEEAAESSIRTYDDSQILDLIKRTQALENQRTSLYGLILIIMGFALLILHYLIGGSNVKDIFAGILMGVSIAEMLVGVYLAAMGFGKQK
ncbi:XRE family transcriptional regulator [Faecalicatena sp. AGMB00832]|uniref:XRE family transcriptional regulator n=1 Tax=Faecalicatena faecalis TaxID=2726362 RepID=A0ABS6D6F0_9FIRM|nr:MULTISPECIES: XRE family transcriptional regulator [Faecalicatena]MBU3877177.1 XRE family transcriptional regulator [Faecalicatena faecalis]MCI6467251.1 XRE family transcriptional regulator [Faecalicatena sp.]MDY5620256.1 XRE family transcriptional regulator [Lachnospiraceae bacterium]